MKTVYFREDWDIQDTQFLEALKQSYVEIEDDKNIILEFQKCDVFHNGYFHALIIMICYMHEKTKNQLQLLGPDELVLKMLNKIRFLPLGYIRCNEYTELLKNGEMAEIKVIPIKHIKSNEGIHDFLAELNSIKDTLNFDLDFLWIVRGILVELLENGRDHGITSDGELEIYSWGLMNKETISFIVMDMGQGFLQSLLQREENTALVYDNESAVRSVLVDYISSRPNKMYGMGYKTIESSILEKNGKMMICTGDVMAFYQNENTTCKKLSEEIIGSIVYIELDIVKK